MTGSAVFFGWLAATIAGVAEESALAWPAPFVAVTRDRSRKPASPLGTLYVELVAPPMDVQFAPLESQRRHW
jgi:phage tail sheath gpL-like